MNTRKGNVQLVSWGQSSDLEIIAQAGFEHEFLSCFYRVSLRDPSACGRALLRRRVVIIDDVLSDHGFTPFRAVALRAGFRSVQSTPLLSSSGSLWGVLSTHGLEPHHPSQCQLEALRTIAQAAANAIVRLHTLEPGAEDDHSTKVSQARILKSRQLLRRTQKFAENDLDPMFGE